MKNDPNCTLCQLHKTTDRVCVLGNGPRPSEVMIIGEAPGRSEEATGQLFSGQSGKLLRRCLSDVGIEPDDVFIANAVSCRPPDNRTPTKREIAACSKWLNYQIAMVKPKFVLILGNVPLQAITGHSGIKKYRGQHIEKQGVIYFFTYHPAFVLRDPRAEQAFKNDLMRFADIWQFGGIPYERAVNIKIVDSVPMVRQMIEALVGTVSYDLETTCLYPWDDEARIVSIGLGTKDAQWVIPVSAEAWTVPWTWQEILAIMNEVADRLEDCIVVGHNFKYDALWTLVKMGIELTCDFDTMMAHYLIDENDRHGLDHLAGMYLGAKDWDVALTLKQGRSGKFMDHALYLGQDVYYTRKLKSKLEPMLDEELMRVYKKIILPCIALFVRVEFRGLYINTPKMKDAEEYLRDEMAKALVELNKFTEAKKIKPLNWGSPKQVGEFLYGRLGIACPQKTKTGANSTSESALNQIDHPCVAALLRYRGAKQQVSFFIEGWWPYLKDSRLHPSFKLHGTVTGRLSAEHPNMQQVPRDERIRSLISAPPGWTLVEADLSQVEVRITAELSGERNFLEAFNSNIDVHLRTALKMMSLSGDYSMVTDTAVKILDLWQLTEECIPDLKTIMGVLKNADTFRQVILDNQNSETSLRSLQDRVSALLNQKPILQQEVSDMGKESSIRTQTVIGEFRGKSSELERRSSKLGDKILPENVLRSLRKLNETARNASHRRGRNEQRTVKLDNALFLVSQAGPQICENINKAWKEKRKLAKALVFGLIYGMWWKKLIIYARDNYNITLTEQQAQEFRKAFFELYSDLPGWHNRQRNFVRKHGYVTSLVGRKRHLPKAMIRNAKKFTRENAEQQEAERQAINSPVQSFANELNLMAAIQLSREFPRRYFNIVATVHDAILCEVRNDMIPTVAPRILEVMSHPLLLDEFGIKLSVPIEADMKIGDWSQGVSYQKWALKSIETKSPIGRPKRRIDL